MAVCPTRNLLVPSKTKLEPERCLTTSNDAKEHSFISNEHRFESTSKQKTRLNNSSSLFFLPDKNRRLLNRIYWKISPCYVVHMVQSRYCCLFRKQCKLNLIARCDETLHAYDKKCKEGSSYQ